ncbi:Vwa8 [Symbiodinium necroappetens]|uniref:Vwa8 protein n=1 Tax=Symbiodinium necroappetens TaxID=1628268 RepID=A0A813C2B6_9DINO|nr:Vwa8 [Symbiodinium necroappetens]
MTKPKRPKYETVQYTPPTPQVFGSQLPSDIPVSKPPSTSSSFSVDRPRNRPKLQDRLAVYEDDNPRCQQLICTIGILFPPLWLVGAAMYAATPPAKTATREAGFRNLILSIILFVLLIVYAVYRFYTPGGLSPGR